MAVRPPRFDTQFVGLTQTAADLAGMSSILPDGPTDAPEATGLGEIPYRFVDVFVQCTAGNGRWVEAATAPTADGDGHVLGTGDGVVLRLERGRPIWFWAPTGTAHLAISPAAASPTRDATFDYDLGA